MLRAIARIAFSCSCLVAAGCGGNDSAAPSEGLATAPASSTGATAATTSEAHALVGRWERVNECPQLVKAFEEAELEDIASSFAGDFFPDSTPKELADKNDLCEGAEPIVHSHFFDEAGAFGSLTEDLEQVDDGTYEVVDEGTVVISKEFGEITFRYSINGEELSLSPVLTEEMKKEALAHPLDFTAAGWTIAMSYPGQTWRRVDCRGWC